jgi:hypothetical protein
VAGVPAVARMAAMSGVPSGTAGIVSMIAVAAA